MNYLPATLNLSPIQEDSVMGFRIVRSLSCNRKFNIIAIGYSDEILATVSTDLSAEEAVELVEILNQPYDLEAKVLKAKQSFQDSVDYARYTAYNSFKVKE